MLHEAICVAFSFETSQLSVSWHDLLNVSDRGFREYGKLNHLKK